VQRRLSSLSERLSRPRMTAYSSLSAVTVAAGFGGGVMPCQNPRHAVTDQIRATPAPPSERFDLLSAFTWYTAPAGYRLPAPIGWRVYTEQGGTTCLYDSNMDRLMSVEELPAAVPDPVAHWTRTAEEQQRDGTLVGYAEATVTRSQLFDGGAEWEYEFTPVNAEPQRAIRVLYNVAGRAYVITWTCPKLDWNTAWLPTIKLGFRPPAPAD
ncbi:hypothetical protein, partial [Asanoa sp. NPDC050611]|uniref:hypothetical protein n=1 Tax=Asanoa sp. NPDC050611 TaxID=3157098 RepID=UPI0033F28463